MKVAVNVLESEPEPHICFHDEHTLAVMLRPGYFEVGRHSSEMRTLECYSGQTILSRRNEQRWVRIQSGGLHVMKISISNTALTMACNGTNDEIELRSVDDLVDSRVGALVNVVNAERIAGFPSGQFFLDSVEQALAVALVDGYATVRRSPRTYRGGLGPARLRKVKELVHAKVEEELTLEEMAQVAELSKGHFSQMFRKSTGQSPHQFVLSHRIERAKGMLCAAEARVLDVAVACGFKTQQHFARVFRQVCGVSPTEYRYESLR